jgi:hypothetical protein
MMKKVSTMFAALAALAAFTFAGQDAHASDTCNGDWDCPTGWTCNPNSGVCEESIPNCPSNIAFSSADIINYQSGGGLTVRGLGSNTPETITWNLSGGDQCMTHLASTVNPNASSCGTNYCDEVNSSNFFHNQTLMSHNHKYGWSRLTQYGSFWSVSFWYCEECIPDDYCGDGQSCMY